MLPTYQLKTDRDAFIQGKTSTPGGASAIGHHFIQAYNQNKWGFYLRYIRGLRKKTTKPPLIFGGCIHDAKEAYYAFGFDEDFMLDVFLEVMNARQKEYEDHNVYLKDVERGRKMLFFWANTWGEADQAAYDIIEVEGQHEFQLANGLPVSVRWDLLAQRKDNKKYYLFDTKTTGYSVMKSYESVTGQDQATMYLLAGSKVYPNASIVGLIPDIMYKRQSVVKAERPGIVLRSKRDLVEYEQELIGLHMEMTQKIIALEQGFPYPHMLFPRNGKDDSFFGTEWPDIYRGGLPSDPKKAPVGYVIDETLIDNGPYGKKSLRATNGYDKILDIIDGIGGTT